MIEDEAQLTLPTPTRQFRPVGVKWALATTGHTLFMNIVINFVANRI